MSGFINGTSVMKHSRNVNIFRLVINYPHEPYLQILKIGLLFNSSSALNCNNASHGFSVSEELTSSVPSLN